MENDENEKFTIVQKYLQIRNDYKEKIFYKILKL